MASMTLTPSAEEKMGPKLRALGLALVYMVRS